MHPVVEAKRAEITRLCRQLEVARLDLFGSATGDAFDSLISDVDVIVEFPDQPGFDYFGHYFDLKEGLERIFERPVDVVTAGSVANPYLKAEIEASRELFYAA